MGISEDTAYHEKGMDKSFEVKEEEVKEILKVGDIKDEVRTCKD